MTRLDRTIVSQLTPTVQGFFARLAILQILMALLAGISFTEPLSAQQLVSWQGQLRNATGNPIHGATVELTAPGHKATAVTQPDGSFLFHQLPPLHFALFVTVDGRRVASPQAIDLATPQAPVLLTLTSQETLSLQPLANAQETTGGVDLSSQSVSQLPLNKRDFSQLLLLAAGTMTDANGATNFTQQFAINGQRGVEATFAMDGADISDPEMGGSTFSNFNVDAVEEIQSQSGWMPAEIGRGAAGFTNIVTRSGKSGFHGSFFEFVRNSAFDARNYFDHSSIANPGRLPPFRRNEFGFTNGGPVILPHIYNGSGKTFYFGQYQGFRQDLGTTQVFPVPTAQERAGQDTTAFPGDTLLVPVDPGIARVLARYPLPNDPLGPYGEHSYASSSPVVTNADQFSLRLDHKISDRSQFFARFNFNDLYGPTTNPDQTTIDPAFGIRYIDHQRNLVLTFTRTVSPRLVLETSASITRATPSFPTTDLTDPAVKFNDGSYEPFNQPAGTVISIYGNLFQLRQSLSFTTASHAFKAGAEMRLNRDTTYFGISPDGEYDFGAGTAYSPINIPSQSGLHNIRAGDPLPDTLSSLLSGSPFVYTVVVAPPYFSGDSTSDRRPSTATPLRFTPRTRGRSPPAWCSTTVCAMSSTRLSPSVPKEPRAWRLPTLPRESSNSSSSILSLPIASISMAWDRGSSSIGWLAPRFTSVLPAESPPSRPIYTRTIRPPARLPLLRIPASPPRRGRPSGMASRSHRTSCRSSTHPRGRTFSPRVPRPCTPTPSEAQTFSDSRPSSRLRSSSSR